MVIQPLVVSFMMIMSEEFVYSIPPLDICEIVPNENLNWGFWGQHFSLKKLPLKIEGGGGNSSCCAVRYIPARTFFGEIFIKYGILYHINQYSEPLYLYLYLPVHGKSVYRTHAIPLLKPLQVSQQ